MTDAQAQFSWGHVNVNVSDLDRSVAFYELLGFREFMPAIPYLGLTRGELAPLPQAAVEALGLPAGTRGRACILQLDDGFPKLDLTQFEPASSLAPLSSGDRGIVRLCLACADLDAQVARLRAAGVEFESLPRSGVADLVDIAVCVDPDGTRIELLRIYPERWAAAATP